MIPSREDNIRRQERGDRIMAEEYCPLCGRVLGTVNIDRHHLIPRTFKGKEQFALHKICHRKIHSAFTERELLRSLHSWEALRKTEEIQTFIAWVANKPPEFYSRTATSNKKKKK
jgi:5-methylcytosine-specific restriction endonuclease McrA